MKKIMDNGFGRFIVFIICMKVFSLLGKTVMTFLLDICDNIFFIVIAYIVSCIVAFILAMCSINAIYSYHRSKKEEISFKEAWKNKTNHVDDFF